MPVKSERTSLPGPAAEYTYEQVENAKRNQVQTIRNRMEK